LQAPRSLPGPIIITTIIITIITTRKRLFSRRFSPSRGQQPLCVFSLIAFCSTVESC
jgi:hypothetical protein